MITIRFTGLDDLRGKFSQAPHVVERVIGKALKHSLAMVETEGKRRTPVKTGYLRSSIGGAGGFSYVRGLTAGVGTNVRYAVYVELNEKARHRIGQAHYMRDGARSSVSYIEEQFTKALEELAASFTK